MGENGSRSKDQDAEIDTEEVKLGGNLTVLLPTGWRSEQLPDGRWWCGSADEHESAVIHAAVAGRREGTPAGATWTEAAKVYLDYFTDVLNGIDGVDEIESKATPTGYLLRSRGRYVEDDGTFRERRWYLFRGVEGGVMIFRVALHLREPARNLHRRDGLVKLFEDQVLRVHGRALDPDEPDHEVLQDFTMDGLVALRLPLRWRCRQEGEDWYCADPDGRRGRLWAGYDLFRPHDDIQTTEGSAAQSLAQDWADAWKPDGSRVLRTEVRLAPLGAIAHLIDEDADAGNDPLDPPLRNYRWLYFTLRDGKPGVMSRYTLMIPIAQAEQPEMQALVGLIAREVERQRLIDEDDR